MKIRTPAELMDALGRTFPTYVHDAEDQPTTYHRALMDFIRYFGANNATFHDRQLREFAQIINEAIEAGGDLENAFGTCFLAGC
jgi:hypothetical protein